MRNETAYQRDRLRLRESNRSTCASVGAIKKPKTMQDGLGFSLAALAESEYRLKNYWSAKHHVDFTLRLRWIFTGFWPLTKTA